MQSYRSLGRTALVVLAATCAFNAWAQVPATSLALAFLQPTGTVGPNTSIAVNLRLTNNDATGTFRVDNSAPNLGLDSSMLPTSGQGTDANGNAFSAPFASYTSALLGPAFGCSGSFTSSCTSGPPYTFQFAASPFSQPFSLAPGAHFDYLFGTFVPSNGPVAPGTYAFYRAVIALYVYGADANGTALSALQFPVQTCNGNSAAECVGATFARTVSAVPEPGSLALLLAGFGLVAAAVRRRG